ncbi:MAG: hypothetical protein QM722_03650 [Piscinibacter sp.]
MPHNRFATLLLATVPLAAAAQDATITDPDKYRVLLDNHCVRVLSYRDEPGARTHEHHHPDFVVVALAPFRRSLQLPDGRRLERDFQAGDVMWSPAQTHIGENIGSTPTQVVMVELKPQSASAACGRN